MVRVSSAAHDGLTFAVTPDFLSVGEAEVLARALARWEPSDDAAQLLADRAANARAGQEFLDVFGIADARLWDPRQLWGQVTGADPVAGAVGKNADRQAGLAGLEGGCRGRDGSARHDDRADGQRQV